MNIQHARANIKCRVKADKLSCEMAETNEDSSYDSDFETDEICVTERSHVSRSSSGGLSSHHDVSRTVSDTLGAEFAEYVNSDQINDNITKSPGYTSRLEFGLKLGYTETLVQTALRRLNPEPSNNELLEELIKLSAAAPKPNFAFKEDILEQQLTNIASSSQLRHIVVDGSNVAMGHGNSTVFSCKGIKICVDWFKARGHTEITVFVPKWRKEAHSINNMISDQEILTELEKERLLVYTPSRLVAGKRYICYDDRYILRLAAQEDGIVVSNDNYRDLIQENADFRKVIEERILMYSFVNDSFMPPDDPMGRNGPNLDTFLRKKSKKLDQVATCPYGRKCTYGNKCRYNHPERGNIPQKPVAEQLSEYAQRQMAGKLNLTESLKHDLKTKSLPLSSENHSGSVPKKMPLSRTKSAAPAPSVPPLDPAMQASMVSNFNRAQIDYQRRGMGDYRFTNPIDAPPKSHSIDNLASNFQDIKLAPPLPHASSQNFNYSQQNIWGSPDAPPMGDQSWSSLYRNNQEQQQQSETMNMHKKLHRQLTLNPHYDPRLYRMNRNNVLPQNVNSQQSNNLWPNHQAVGRMASDPTAGPWSSASWGNPTQTSHHEARSRTHYLLSGIFPEEKVNKAMALMPDETDPQKICAFIISLSPK